MSQREGQRAVATKSKPEVEKEAQRGGRSTATAQPVGVGRPRGGRVPDWGRGAGRGGKTLRKQLREQTKQQ